MKKNILRYITLFVLFIVPLLFYIFLQLSTHNFGKLPVKIKDVMDVSILDTKQSLKNKVSIVTFLGSNFDKSNKNFFNLNDQVYKNFYGYKDFQLIAILPKGTEEKVAELKEKTKLLSNPEKLNFIFANPVEINALYSSFGSVESLNKFNESSLAFIIDKANNLRRGKTKDKKKPNKLGYNMNSISELKKEMKDDVKILLAEYRFALKKHNRKSRKDFINL